MTRSNTHADANGGGRGNHRSSHRSIDGRHQHYRSRLQALAAAEIHQAQSSGSLACADANNGNTATTCTTNTGYMSDSDKSQCTAGTAASGVSTSLLDVATTTLQELGIWSSSPGMPQEVAAGSSFAHYDGDQVEISLMPHAAEKHEATAAGAGAVRVLVNGIRVFLDGDDCSERRKSASSDKDTDSTARSADGDCFDDINDGGQKKKSNGEKHGQGICSSSNRLPCIVLLTLLGLVAVVVAAIFGKADEAHRPSTPTAEPTPSPSPGPTASPTGQPTSAPVPPFRLNQFGQLQYDRVTQIHVAEGLSITSIGRTGESVPFTSPHATVPNSGTCKFHTQPDGAATFYDPVVDND